MTIRRLAFALLLSMPFVAHAGTWHADNRNSTLAFSGVSQGETFNGKFKAFAATIAFDPAQLATSRFLVKINLASADTANAERDEALHGKDFFDAAHTPVATYTAAAFRSLGGGRYAADGTLNLHGISKLVTLTFTWVAGATPSLTGDAVVNRLDFNVGTGDWADTSQIGNAVKVHTMLKLGPPTPPTLLKK